MSAIRAAWDSQAWRVADSLRMALSDLRALAGDLASIGWCQLRLAHHLELDAAALEVPIDERNEPVHRWCPSCTWCEDCNRRRTDLRGAAEVSWP